MTGSALMAWMRMLVHATHPEFDAVIQFSKWPITIHLQPLNYSDDDYASSAVVQVTRDQVERERCRSFEHLVTLVTDMMTCPDIKVMPLPMLKLVAFTCTNRIAGRIYELVPDDTTIRVVVKEEHMRQFDVDVFPVCANKFPRVIALLVSSYLQNDTSFLL